MKFLILLSCFWSLPSLAQGPVKDYNCAIRVFSSDLPKGYAEALFTAPVRGASSHGGDSFDFTFQKHSVSVLANGRWMGISWARDGVLISQTLMARGSDNQDSLVVMAYDPKNLEEYASLDCTAQFEQSQTGTGP